MATAGQILDDILDWCIKNTNISESKGEDEDGDQINFIHFAAEKGYVQVLKKLADSGIDVNCTAPNRYKSTPLHYASLNGHLEVAKLLLQKGANINCQDKNKQTPLHFAQIFGKKEIMKLLLENGCDIDLKDNYGKTAEEIAVSNGFHEIAALITSKRMESLALNHNNCAVEEY